MKKILLLLAAVIYAGFAYSQGEHLPFKGIPITGAASDFADELVRQGYDIQTSDDGSIVLKGKFTDKDCLIVLTVTPQSKIVSGVGVLFDEKYNTWSSIKSEYNRYKKLYEKKYGIPQIDNHRFDRPYYEGDGYEMTALRVDKCNYLTAWQLKNGTIALKMAENQIMLLYSDKVNNALDDMESVQASLDDI